MKSNYRIISCLATAAASFTSLQAGTIVPDLNDSSAIFNATTPTVSTTGTVTLGQGVTLAARLTPSAADITSSASGAVAMIEIGGTTSGTGLWIISGNLWFLSSSGNNLAGPTSMLDLNGSDAAIGVQLGAMTAGVESTVWASFDTTGGILRVSQDSVISTFSLTGVTGTWNWGGNRTVGFGTADPTVTNGNLGSRGGLVDGGTDPLVNTNNSLSFAGAVANGQVFNGISSVPEPGVPSLLGVALAGMVFCRRSRKV